MHLLVLLPYINSLVRSQGLFKINKINVYNICKNTDKQILKEKLLKYESFNLYKTHQKEILDLFVVSTLMQFDCDLATQKDHELTNHLNYMIMAD